MKGRSSGKEFEDYLLMVDDLGAHGIIHYFKKLLTLQGAIKFINIDDVLVVTGDYGKMISIVV